MPVSLPIEFTNKKNSNKDRYRIDETLDLTPSKVYDAFQKANSGYVKCQSRIANELTEKDNAISQAWSVRVAAIASCPWEMVGGESGQAEELAKILRNIQPSYNDNLVSFYGLLEGLQEAILHGFAVARTEWTKSGDNIHGFKLYSQSCFSFYNSDLPYYSGCGSDLLNFESRIVPRYPQWIYHTASNARQAEPLRSGLVRPLAYTYAFRRHVLIPMLRGIEKYGHPLTVAEIDEFMYEDTTQKQQFETMLANMTYDGWALFPKDKFTLTFPSADSGFDINTFMTYLEYSEKQIFRLLLGQDSTSSADNSNRSTAQVHNLVRADMLARDAKTVEETVNDQIIKPLHTQIYGESDNRPKFRFRLKGTQELKEIADILKTLNEAGKTISNDVLSERMGLPVQDLNSSEEPVTND